MKKRQSEPATNDGTPCDQGRVSFSLETRIGHRQFKISSWKHLRTTRLLVILSSPLIYACVLPFLLLDAAVAIYQLTIERVGCIYCSYANGLLGFVTEVAARTEQYFCPIKHARPLVGMHSRYARFLPYGDARAYREQSAALARAYSDLAARVK